MKKPSIYFLMMMFAVASVIGGCNKDEDDDDNTNNTQTAVIGTTDLFNYSDGFGVFAAVNTVTYVTAPIVGTIEQTTGTAVAAVWNTAGSTTYVAMGDVTCNTNTLTKQSNNSYVFTPSQTAPTGIDFSSGSSWTISGSADVPAFSYGLSVFPDNPTITSDKDEVVLADGYTFTVSGLGGADSVLYILASGNSYVEKRVSGFTNSVTFTASELSTLQPSTYGLIQVTPYNVYPYTPNGKKYYFIHQVTVSDFAEFK